MFAVADLIVLEAIEKGLENLRNNPHHLEFILGRYEETCYMRKLHGTQYIRQCKELILQNKISVRPFYVLDLAKLPSISVLAQYQEDTQVFGDYGSVDEMKEIAPKVLGQMQAVSWGIEDTELVVSGLDTIANWIYPGLYLRQDDFNTKIIMIIPVENNRAVICCENPLPKTRLVDWEVTDIPYSRMAILNSSGNMASVSIEVKSSGDIEVHKLLALVVRYCLRKERLFMDSAGLQISISSQSFPILQDEEQGIFQSHFSLQGKIWDCWIQEEVDNQVPSLSFQAESEDRSDQNVQWTF
jgi:hypothetical protein